MLQVEKVKTIRQEIARCEWNLDRDNFADMPNMMNTYRSDWAAHRAYFMNELHIYKTILAFALGFEVGIIEQGIGL